jgi:hypothetical protein
MNHITGVVFSFAYCTVAVTYVRTAQMLFRVITYRRMRWARHVARMGDSRGQHRILWGDLRGRDHWEDLGVGGRVKVKWGEGHGLDCSGSG